jgi:hypothetical protein
MGRKGGREKKSRERERERERDREIMKATSCLKCRSDTC